MIAGIPFTRCHEARWHGTSATATARKQTPYLYQLNSIYTKYCNLYQIGKERLIRAPYPREREREREREIDREREREREIERHREREIIFIQINRNNYTIIYNYTD